MCVLEEQLVTGWGFNQLWLEPLGGDFQSVNTQFPPGGFGSTSCFPPTALSVFPPGDFVESANSLPPVDVHVKNSLSKFDWENVFSPDNFDPMNVDDGRTFSCCERRPIYDLGQVSPVRKLIVPSEIGSQRKPGEVCSGL